MTTRLGSGWNMPPGCYRTPWDDPMPPCPMCRTDADWCQCPECPECGAVGDIECYRAGHLEFSEDQIENMALCRAEQANEY
jgi:hypothetical protein